jgi:glycosyltransferase involved in cell wall biosynthesis
LSSINDDGRVALRIFVAHPSALLTDHRPHGDGLVAFGFIRELAARGHELHVAAPHVDLRGTLPPNVHVHLLGAGGHPAPLDRLRFMRRMRRLYRRLTRATTFDLVHQLNPVDVGLSLALADVRVPVVLGPYVPDWAPSGEGADAPVSRAGLGLKGVLRTLEQWRATTLLLSTPAAASKIKLGASPRLHVRELSPGIDEREWRPAAGGGRAQDVLFLANLEVRKGIHVALDAFARLALELPRARLLVAGAGSEVNEVRRRIQASPAPERVELLGHVERERTMAVMQACDVYCLPSYGEPFGMTALEAMACAKPVVATDAGGLRYLVPDRGGRRVPPGDALALAAALREVLADPRLRRAMGEHNRRVVEERYAWSRVVDRLEDLYREAIREPRPGIKRSPHVGGSRRRAPGRR